MKDNSPSRRLATGNMASRTVIPRFLLPLQSPLWRTSARVPKGSPLRGGVRHNSDKPIVLEKPLKFNPPSHGSRLRNKTLPKHYGAVITPEELSAQKMKSYPGVMAPEGTWQHFFWHSRMLHTCITLVSTSPAQNFLGSTKTNTVFTGNTLHPRALNILPPLRHLFPLQRPRPSHLRPLDAALPLHQHVEARHHTARAGQEPACY